MLLSLDSLTLEAPLNASGQCLVLVECILPRNGIARKAALKDVQLTRGRRSLARQPFYERALLKEKVDGPFGLKVSVTRPLKHPELHAFVRRLLATGIESSADLLASSVLRQTVPGDLAEDAGDWLADRIAEDAPSFIALGGLDLDSETLHPGRLRIPLQLTQTQRVATPQPGPRSRDHRKQSTKTYKKGTVLGEVQLQLQP